MNLQFSRKLHNSYIIYSTLIVLSPYLCYAKTLCLSDYNVDKIEQEAIFVNITNENIYKKWMRPHSQYEFVGHYYQDNLFTSGTVGTQIQVNTSMEVYSMASVNERESEFTLNLLIDLMWNDPRLAIHSYKPCPELSDLSIEGSEWHLERIWSPKLRVPSNKNPSALDRDAKIILLRISAKGDVRVRKRLILDLYCQMHFQKYPFDNQTCTVDFISSDLSIEHLELKWTNRSHENPFILNNSSYMTGFTLIDVDKDHLTSGNALTKGQLFSRVSVRFELKRQWSHFLLDIYLPSTLVVIVSWTSFWMDITATPARITLGVTTLLTFVTISKDSREDLPNIPYVNALDVWFVICTGFIFLSLIEYIIVTYISRAERRKIREMKTLRKNLSQSQLSLDRMSSPETQTTITTNDYFLSPPKTPNQSLNTRFPFEGIEIKVPKSPHLADRRIQSQTSVTLTPALKRLQLTLTPPETPNPDIESRMGGSNSGPQIELKLTPWEIAEAVDRKCRYLFPLAFCLFNLIYWLYIILIK